jgi:hypothetical protein
MVPGTLLASINSLLSATNWNEGRCSAELVAGVPLCTPLCCHAEIGSGFFKTYVIGDFTQDEARRFLERCLGMLGKPAVADADWDLVYKVSHRYLPMVQAKHPTVE